jgi:hypothetical protein
MQPLDSMRMELCKDARRVEACFGDEFVRRVGAGGAWPVAADGVCKGCVFGTYEVSCAGEVIVCAVLPFPYLNLFYGCVTSATV